MKKKYHTGPNKMYQSQGQSLPEARTLHFGQCEGSIKAKTCIPPKRVMTGNRLASSGGLGYRSTPKSIWLMAGKHSSLKEKSVQIP